MSSFKDEYLELAILFAKANRAAFESKRVTRFVVNSNVRKSNKIRIKLDQICKTALTNGYLTEIEVFLYHEDNYVRCITAMYFLFVLPELAEKVLNELTELPIPDPVRLQANSFLFFWKKGILEF